ncbi:MAG: hypothetical protein KBS78_07315 [Bacteroidales bacterium]|nr:hypothetical protein [Candidatus Cryptobacteroides faecihippi]
MRDTIVLNGQTFRVEANWNALVAFFEATGRDDMAALSNFGQLKPSDMAALMAACINEGERLDGHDCQLTAKQVGEMSDLGVISEFLSIYVKQTTKAGSKSTDQPKNE